MKRTNCKLGHSEKFSCPECKKMNKKEIFIKELRDFIEDKTILKKGFPTRVVFLLFEFEEFLKEKGDKE